MSNIFFTSDTHVWHRNILKHANRPFDSIEEMNDTIISNWNRVVKSNDDVWHLGDVSFGNRAQTEAFLDSLNGRIHLIWGNHDKPLKGSVLGKFASAQYYRELKYGNELFCLLHFPMVTWNKGHHGSYHLHGHCHGGLNTLNEGTTRLDVGVDNFNFTPVHADEVIEILSKRTYRVVDHHK